MLQIANAVSTAASNGADLNGGAVKDACTKLRHSLEKFLTLQSKKPEGSKSKLLQHWDKYGSWYQPGDDSYNCWPDVCDAHEEFSSIWYLGNCYENGGRCRCILI